MKINNLLSITIYLSVLILLVACGRSKGTSDTASIDLEPFITQAKSTSCADSKNKLYFINDQLVLWDRDGSCPDSSFQLVLYNESINQVMCERYDSIDGEQIIYNDESYKELFDIMKINLDKADLGLGSSYNVEEILF